MIDKKSTTQKPPIEKKAVAVKKEEQKPVTPKPGEAPKPAVKQEPRVLRLTEIMAGFSKKRDVSERQRHAFESRMESGRKAIQRFEAVVAQAESRLASIVVPSVRDDVVTPLARELVKLIPNHTFDIIGPFSPMEAVTLVFMPKEATPADRASGKGGRSITLVTKLEGGGLGIRDFSKDLKTYAAGTWQAGCGMNHPTVKVPTDADLQFFMNWVK